MNKLTKVKLSDVADIIGGGTPDTKKQEFWNGNIPWITPKDLSSYNYRYISNGERNITKKGLENSSARILPQGSILLTSRAPIGYIAIAQNELCTNQGFKSLILKENNCPLFFYYLLKNNIKYIINMSSGSTFPEISGSQVKNLEFNIPDLTTQEKIARVLSSLDDKIELNNKINQNLEQQAQAIFKSWFVDFEPFGGKMPDDWKVGNLYEIANVTMGQSPDGKSYNENGYGEVFYQGRAEFGSRYPTRRLYTTEPKRMANAGDILMSVRAPVGDINVALEKCCIGRGLASISSRDNFNSFILYTLMNLKRSFDIYNAEGTVFGAINKDSLNSIEVIIPTKEEIYKFEEIVSNLDKMIRQNTIEVQKLQKIRDTLLPKLMSGEIDVSKIGDYII